MPTFITIAYGDRAGYDATDQAALDVAHEHDSRLAARGFPMGIAGTPVQVRNHDGAGVRTTQGAYLTSELPIAGFGVFTADTLEEAIELAAGSPCAVAQGVIEVWPLQS